MARFILSVDSFTEVSARPIMLKYGSPELISVSMSTNTLSSPLSAAVLVFASILHIPPKIPDLQYD